MSTTIDPPEAPHRATTDTRIAAGRVVDVAQLETAASALASDAQERTDELEAGRRIPADLYQAAAAAGLFRQLVVTDMGGFERTPLEWFRTGFAMARIEPSIAWVVTQGAAELGWVAAGGDDRWARDFLSDPLATSASSSAGLGSLAIDGDRSRFQGRWAFNTGSQGASWLGGLALIDGEVDEAGLPVIRWGWVPADRAEVLGDWEPTGLRGTGSHSTVIADQEIPTAWTFDPYSPTQNDRGPHRCVVGNGSWPIATSVAAVQLGNARRALDEATTIVVDKKPPPDFRPLAGNAAVQRWLAESEGRWLAALASVERELVTMWDEARADGAVSREQRVRLHRANLAANAMSVQVVDAACRITGTAAVPHRSILGRCRRDAQALEGHVTVNGAAAEHNSRVHLGFADSHILV